MLGRMAVNISIDLSDATFADLVALVDAARVAGIDGAAALELEDTTLCVGVEPAGIAPVRPEAQADKPARDGHLPPLGDAAIRSVVDILTGRQEPPRR